MGGLVLPRVFSGEKREGGRFWTIVRGERPWLLGERKEEKKGEKREKEY